MNIQISETTDSEVESFERKEWRAVDMEHYGREVEWEEWKPTFFLFKAEKKSKIIGVIGGHLIAGVLFIERILVTRAERNMGIGKMLLAEPEEYAKEIHAHKIYLYTGKDWEAIQFYLKHGYEKTGELPNHFMKKDFVIYSKDI